MAGCCIDPHELPLIEVGQVEEHFVDFMGPVKIIGPNFWVTFGRILVPPGLTREARVPLVRIGRTLDTYKRNELARLIEEQRALSATEEGLRLQ